MFTDRNVNRGVATHHQHTTNITFLYGDVFTVNWAEYEDIFCCPERDLSKNIESTIKTSG